MSDFQGIKVSVINGVTDGLLTADAAGIAADRIATRHAFQM